MPQIVFILTKLHSIFKMYIEIVSIYYTVSNSCKSACNSSSLKFHPAEPCLCLPFSRASHVPWKIPLFRSPEPSPAAVQSSPGSASTPLSACRGASTLRTVSRSPAPSPGSCRTGYFQLPGRAAGPTVRFIRSPCQTGSQSRTTHRQDLQGQYYESKYKD